MESCRFNGCIETFANLNSLTSEQVIVIHVKFLEKEFGFGFGGLEAGGFGSRGVDLHIEVIGHAAGSFKVPGIADQ